MKRGGSRESLSTHPCNTQNREQTLDACDNVTWGHSESQLSRLLTWSVSSLLGGSLAASLVTTCLCMNSACVAFAGSIHLIVRKVCTCLWLAVDTNVSFNGWPNLNRFKLLNNIKPINYIELLAGVRILIAITISISWHYWISMNLFDGDCDLNLLTFCSVSS